MAESEVYSAGAKALRGIAVKGIYDETVARPKEAVPFTEDSRRYRRLPRKPGN